MKKDKHKTVVIFRKFKKGRDILALFPYIDGGLYFCGSYQHVGQHSSADYDGCIKISTPAKKSEYSDLKKELENLGYNLKVQKRANRNLMYK